MPRTSVICVGGESHLSLSDRSEQIYGQGCVNALAVRWRLRAREGAQMLG